MRISGVIFAIMLLSKLTRCVAVSSGRLRPSRPAPLCSPLLPANPFTGTHVALVTPSSSVLFSAGPGAGAVPPSVELGMKQVQEYVDTKIATEPVVEW
jgi:hypothetical protein